MKVSLDWLGEYVDLTGLKPEEIAEKLTMGAFEVEEITVFGVDLEGPIVAGEIMEIHPHPNADKIRLTRTRIKDGAEPLEIVCGAQNIEVGQIVPVALPGAKVVNRHDGSPLIIKASAIRGVKSNGMLCSAAELGIVCDDAAGEGILILARTSDKEKPSFALGDDVRQILNILPDYILHVEPRSNRGDALSVAGLAREAAALFGRPLKRPDWELAAAEPGTISSGITGTFIENTEDCPYFSLIPISGVKIGPSHPRIAKRLESIGLRPVSNVVDITNYVMHELGQPLHAYDADKLKGKALGVRRAAPGETITTLDGKERKLTDEVLLIVDSHGQSDIPVGIAGIMGGKDSEISDSSTSLVLEAACFTPAVVRRGSRLLGLSSDASLRFERGVDAASVLNAARRAAYLIGKYCGTQDLKIEAPHLAGSDRVQEVAVDLRLKTIKRILDLDMDGKRVATLLSPLGFQVEEAGPGTLKVQVPSFRQTDVKREIDLVEEVCRLNGYDAIEASMPSGTVCRENEDDTLSKAHSTLTGLGLSEAWLSSLVPADDAGIVQDYLVQVLNPLSKDHQYLRQSLVPGLLGALAYNLDRGQKTVWLYETGRVYFKDYLKTTEANPGKNGKNGKTETTGSEKPALEMQRLAGVLCGSGPQGACTFQTVKGVLECLLTSLGLNLSLEKVNWSTGSQLPPWLHPYRTAVLSLNRPPRKGSDLTEAVGVFGNPMVLAYVGQLHPAYGANRGLKEEAFIFEIDLDRLKAERKPPRFSELANTPAVTRDLTCDFPADQAATLQHQTMARLITKKAGSNLKKLELVSIYQPQGEAGGGNVAITYRLTFQHVSETLTSEQIDATLKDVKESLAGELKATFRA